jgi:hypothetical protein
MIRRKSIWKYFVGSPPTFVPNNVNNSNQLKKLNRFKNGESTTIIGMSHYQIVSRSKKKNMILFNRYSHITSL